MKVLWVAGPTEIEADVISDCATAGIDCEIVDVYEIDVCTLPARIRTAAADITVLRHPFYLATDRDVRAEVQALDMPILAWSSEQGTTKNDGECLLGGFRNKAVNNAHDAKAGGYLYMPFGCAYRGRVEYNRKINDVLVDSMRPHYACRDCAGDVKAKSVETMVLPLIGFSMSFYGEWGGRHGWSAVPDAVQHYQGTFPPSMLCEICEQHRVYVGISWNWQSAGYGCKLARAMATGIPVVWHRTPHMALDGLIEGENILCSSSPAETRERVLEAMAKPEIGYEGRQFALENWRWSKLLTRMVNELR